MINRNIRRLINVYKSITFLEIKDLKILKRNFNFVYLIQY